MSGIPGLLRASHGEKYLVIPRLIAAIPLILIGLGHFLDRGTFVAMLEAASIPMPAVNSLLAPGVEVAAGALLLLGLFARLGGLMAVTTMVVALFSHAIIDPAGLPEGVMMPPVALPLGVLVSAAVVAWRGAGALSLDARGIAAGAEPVADPAA